jgi:homopolymeric O-antigen transport system permease protein
VKSLMLALRELRRSRELLYMLTWREIRIRYKQSIMGLLWAVLMPLIITLAGLMLRLVASRATGKPMDSADLGAIGVKALPWAFFVSSLRFGTVSLTGNSSLVTKIKFPRLVFPISSVLTSLVDMLVASPVIVIILCFTGMTLAWSILWAPLLFLLLALFTVGLTVLCAAANLFFRDVKYLVEVVLTFAIFFTPVLYSVNLAGRWGRLLLFNPLAPLLEGLDATVVRGQMPNLPWIGYSAAVAVVITWLGIGFFRRLEPRFAESV